MLTLEEVETLLRLQTQAYDLLMWLADEANCDPEALSPETAAALREPESAGAWLKRRREGLPAELLPRELAGPFANLLSSFFSTSFHVRHLEFEGRLMESRVTLGASPGVGSGVGLEGCQVLALRHLAAAERLPIQEKEARTLVRRKSLHLASLLWTYAWELDRRAKQKTKGSVVHRIWRAIPREMRKPLTAARIWEAREQLLEAVREQYNAERP